MNDKERLQKILDPPSCFNCTLPEQRCFVKKFANTSSWNKPEWKKMKVDININGGVIHCELWKPKNKEK